MQNALSFMHVCHAHALNAWQITNVRVAWAEGVVLHAYEETNIPTWEHRSRRISTTVRAAVSIYSARESFPIIVFDLLVLGTLCRVRYWILLQRGAVVWHATCAQTPKPQDCRIWSAGCIEGQARTREYKRQNGKMKPQRCNKSKIVAGDSGIRSTFVERVPNGKPIAWPARVVQTRTGCEYWYSQRRMTATASIHCVYQNYDHHPHLHIR